MISPAREPTEWCAGMVPVRNKNGQGRICIDLICFPNLPWQEVGMDVLEWKKVTYLIIVDYYSRYIEVARLDRMTPEGVILHCKSIMQGMEFRR